MRLASCAGAAFLSRAGLWMKKDSVDELSPWTMWITQKILQTQESGNLEKGHPYMGVEK
jgi:hypothetical protein